MSLKRLLRSALVPITLACLAATPACAQTYSVTDVGAPFFTDYSIGFGVNNSGQVAGASLDPTGYGFFAIGGPTGTASMPLLLEEGTPTGLNNAGQMSVTEALTTDSPWAAARVTYGSSVGGTITPLVGDGNAWSAGINSLGQVVGYAVSQSGVYHAFVATIGSNGYGNMTDLGTLSANPTQSFATGINATGQVCGYSGTTAGATHAFLLTGATMADLGVLPGATFSQATGLNASGQVVGYSGASTTVYGAFVSSGGSMKSLGSLGGSQTQAKAINASGQIVGFSDTSTGVSHAFLYTASSGMVDLNGLIPGDSGWVLTSANAISDNGYITGAGTVHGASHAFLLTPGGATLARTWKATAVAAGPDGYTRIVWDRADGTASVWKVNSSGQLTTQQQYGPYQGWTARAVATGNLFGAGSLVTEVAWGGTTGGGLQILGPDNVVLDPPVAIPGLTGLNGAVTQGVAANGSANPHSFAANSDGSANVWTVQTSLPGFANNQSYGPYVGWTARSIAVNPDGTVRLLWTNTNGTATFWHLSATNQMIDQHQYGPYSGYTATAIAAAPDGTGRVVWTATDGHIALWTLDANNIYTGQSQYGPYSGWSFQSIAMGSDGNARLLWNNVSGQAALWSLTPGGAFASEYLYGPY
jgi:probable HAF family extracellular repeat protein